MKSLKTIKIKFLFFFEQILNQLKTNDFLRNLSRITTEQFFFSQEEARKIVHQFTKESLGSVKGIY